MTGETFRLGDFLPYLLNRAAEEVSLDFQRHYRDRYGMLRTEWRVLAHLGEHGAMTARDIGRKARIHKTKISRAVTALETKRFLKRTASEKDRRFETLALTPAGRAAVRDLSAIALGFDRKLRESLGEIAMPQLKMALTRLADRPK